MAIENTSANFFSSSADLNRISSSSVRGFNGKNPDANNNAALMRERPNVEIRNKIMVDGRQYNPDAPRGTYLDIKV